MNLIFVNCGIRLDLTFSQEVIVKEDEDEQYHMIFEPSLDVLFKKCHKENFSKAEISQLRKNKYISFLVTVDYPANTILSIQLSEGFIKTNIDPVLQEKIKEIILTKSRVRIFMNRNDLAGKSGSVTKVAIIAPSEW